MFLRNGKKTLLFLFLVMTAFVLSGCSKDRDYTDRDADRLAKSCVGLFSDCELVSKDIDGTDNPEEKRYADTLWTYKEKGERGLTFHVSEQHKDVWVDGSTLKVSSLNTDYDTQLLMYCTKQYDLTCEISPCTEADFVSSRQYVSFRYSCETEEEIDAVADEVASFLKVVKKNGCNINANPGRFVFILGSGERKNTMYYDIDDVAEAGEELRVDLKEELKSTTSGEHQP